MADLITNFKIKIMNYKLFKAVSPLLLICFCLAQCKKTSSAQEDQLPPATQTGANTFGCKINGKVYIPKGYNGTGTPNPHLSFDIGLNSLPYLQIDAKQLNSANNAEGQVLIIFANISRIGRYEYPTDFNFSTGWPKYLNNCGIITFDTTIIKSGWGDIIKYDITNRIISGTFNFKFKTLSCDTVFVTDGRFDYKL